MSTRVGYSTRCVICATCGKVERQRHKFCESGPPAVIGNGRPATHKGGVTPMKAKKIIPEKNEQPNPLPAPSNQERKYELAPWQKEIVALAEARLSVGDEQDIVPHMLRRAIGLCRIVEDMALSTSDSETSLEALA